MTLEPDELNFEDNLIKYLSDLGGTKQWQYEPQIKTTDELWQNFRNILYKLNQDRLAKPLSDTEFDQVKQVINHLATPYEAGQFLYGLNGVSQVNVLLDNGTNVPLTVFDQDQIGGGNTVYQIVNQIQRPSVVPGLPNRRFDTTLLINGLPIIQIEEKADGHEASEALNQMRQYIEERQYTNIFSTLQILIAMTPHEIKYMANSSARDFNKTFAFNWQNADDNRPVLNWREFANKFLSIPMAHQMATNYIILDNKPRHQSIKVMRPYQVYATRRVINKVRHHQFGIDPQEIGYIWHATGSGKTISSFKTAWLASRLPDVDKVVFLVDRIALTNQTTEDYMAYDPEHSDTSGVVTDASNRWDLERKLRAKGNGIIVTSTQKMSAMINREKAVKSIKNKRILFIVDEAHRSTGSTKKKSSNESMIERIKKALPLSAWVGYTGTPVFDGEITTGDIFGPLLHEYNIADAIRDGNVLGFKVDFETTLSKDVLQNKYLPAYFKERYPNWSDKQVRERIQNLKPEDMDDMVESSVYDNNDQHVELVVRDIVKNWNKRSNNGKYNALLTTHVGGQSSSIPMAMKYYREFKKQAPNLKVGITFSSDTSNDDSMLGTNKMLMEAISDYNKTFGTNFGLKDAQDYTAQVVARLNRSIDDGKYFDIVIVVDQLLTGFDAPQLNTLYVDRTLQGAKLIQSYSRTNRVYDMQTKPFGRVVNYRWPVNSEKLMKEALAEYARRHINENDSAINLNTAQDGVLTPDYSEIVEKLAKVTKSIDNETDNFTRIPDNLEKSGQDQLLKDLREYNHLMSMAKQDDEYEPKHPEKLLNKIGMTVDQETVLTTTLAVNLRKQIARRDHVDFSDIDLSMEHLKEVNVSYDYLKQLIAEMLNLKHAGDDSGALKRAQQIKELTDRLEDRKQAEKINSFADSVTNGDYPSETTPIDYPVEQDRVDRLLELYNNDAMHHEILLFNRKWGIDGIEHSSLTERIISNHVAGRDDLDINGELSLIAKEGARVYKSDATDSNVQNLSKLRYRRMLRDNLTKFADQIVKKY